MAVFSKITVQDLSKYNKFLTEEDVTDLTTALASNGAVSATYGAYFDMPEDGSKYLLFIENTAESGADKSVVIKAGNSIQGTDDVSKTNLGYGEYTLIEIESGKFKNVYENDDLKALSSATIASQISAKGKVFITGTDDKIKVAVFKLV